MAPDLDVLFFSPTDPLLFLEYHRGFTHSLMFVPIGALICALVFHGFAKQRLKFREVYLFCLLGYGTHGLLDACTTYGTQLFWPITDLRIAWNNVSVVDPLFTLPLLVLVACSAIYHKPALARIGMIWGLAYLSFGVVQRERAENIGLAIAENRGHTPIRLEAKPGFLNLFLWKVIYETQDQYHVDGVRLGWPHTFIPGNSVDKLVIKRDLPWLKPDSQQRRDLERFRWFSNGYLAVDPIDKLYVIDIRYSMLPNEVQALWGIVMDPAADFTQHVRYVTRRDASPARMQQLIDMLKGP
jgi:inner membrane protein